jgi:hypothetical protein
MQAERNMVKINQERVAALRELDAAYERIAELGARLSSDQCEPSSVRPGLVMAMPEVHFDRSSQDIAHAMAAASAVMCL